MVGPSNDVCDECQASAGTPRGLVPPTLVFQPARPSLRGRKITLYEISILSAANGQLTKPGSRIGVLKCIDTLIRSQGLIDKKPDRDSNLDLHVFGSPFYCESDALDHVATEVGPDILREIGAEEHRNRETGRNLISKAHEGMNQKRAGGKQLHGVEQGKHHRYANGLGIIKFKFIGSVSEFSWRKGGKPFRKNCLQYTRPGPNHGIPVIGKLVYCEGSGLVRTATEAVVNNYMYLQTGSLGKRANALTVELFRNRPVNSGLFSLILELAC
uniref:Uncharacterized protein n=1 Tax=Timema douglasi TaxID=61478 RepID=A0A7R8Z8C2_TIMDO|nr:unnamed protein product [Timema douglasi]